MDELIKTENLHRKYKLGKKNLIHALRGATLIVNQGEMTAIMGPSGSGKSTLMHIMGCLDRADEGEVWLNQNRVDKARGRRLTQIRSKDVGFIFQDFSLIPTMTALENVAQAAKYAGRSRKESTQTAKQVLGQVGLGDRIKHRPNELSGGEQQRVAIARALVNDPVVVLGDEPTGNLDTATSNEIIKMMKEINQSSGKTFVLVTHDPEVSEACDRIIHMRDGVIVEDKRNHKNR